MVDAVTTTPRALRRQKLIEMALLAAGINPTARRVQELEQRFAGAKTRHLKRLARRSVTHNGAGRVVKDDI